MKGNGHFPASALVRIGQPLELLQIARTTRVQAVMERQFPGVTDCVVPMRTADA
jgi:hypothetical protein